MQSATTQTTSEDSQPQAKRPKQEDNTTTLTAFGSSIVKTEDHVAKPNDNEWMLEKKRILKLYSKSYKDEETPPKKRYHARKTTTR